MAASQTVGLPHLLVGGDACDKPRELGLEKNKDRAKIKVKERDLPSHPVAWCTEIIRITPNS